MKTRHAVLLYLLGFLVYAIGAILKILHLQGAEGTIIVATVIQSTAEILFIFKLLTNPKMKEFLDW